MSPHRAQLVKMVKRHGWQTGVELGVNKGILFLMLLEQCQRLRLFGVDTCPVPHRKAKCLAIAEKYKDRASMLVMTTDEAVSWFAHQSMDFVFIDADHSFRAVQSDIAHWAPIVKKGGWLLGHDYNAKWPGVVAAVDQVFGISVSVFPGSIWGVRL